MNLESLQRAKNCESCIKSANHNIEHLEKIKKSNEIMVVVNTSEAYKAIKETYYDGKLNLAPVYYTGETKDKIIDIAIEENKAFRDKHIEKLKKI